MGAKRRSFSPEFKQEAVRLLVDSKRPAGTSPTSEADELRRLRREVEVLRLRYAAIARYQDAFPVTLMCRVLGVSRAGRRTPSRPRR